MISASSIENPRMVAKVERVDIVAACHKFLRAMHSLRMSDTSTARVYLDETWVNQNHTRSTYWEFSNITKGVEGTRGQG